MKKILIVEIVLLSLVLALFLGLAGYLYVSDSLTADPEADLPVLQASIPEPEAQEAFSLADPSWMEGISSDRSLEAQEYFVYDVTNACFLVASHSTDTRIYPASITKLMTALVALEHLDPADLVVVGEEVELIDPDSSVAGIEVGDSLTVAQLVEGMLLPSGNDAAYAIAAAAGRKILEEPTAVPEAAVEAFVAEMNRRASELGMTGSHFVNPDGIHGDEHYMTIGNLAVLGRLSLNNALIREYAALAVGNNPRYDDTLTEEDAPRQWYNTNVLINQASPYYCPYALGLKTGQTNAAGACLLSAFQYRGCEYLIGVFQCGETQDRFEDTRQLFLECVVNHGSFAVLETASNTHSP